MVTVLNSTLSSGPTVATRMPVGLEKRGGWGDTVIVVPGHRFTDVISGRTFEGNSIPLADLLSKYPVALLRPEVVEETETVEDGLDEPSREELGE